MKISATFERLNEYLGNVENYLAQSHLAKLPRYFDEGTESNFYQLLQDMFRASYFQVHEHVINSTTDYFKEPDFLIF